MLRRGRPKVGHFPAFDRQAAVYLVVSVSGLLFFGLDTPQDVLQGFGGPAGAAISALFALYLMLCFAPCCVPRHGHQDGCLGLGSGTAGHQECAESGRKRRALPRGAPRSSLLLRARLHDASRRAAALRTLWRRARAPQMPEGGSGTPA